MPSGGFVGMDSFPFNPKSNFGQKRITLKDFNNVKNLHAEKDLRSRTIIPDFSH